MASEPALSPALQYQTIPGVSPEPITEGAGLKTREDLEAFVDGMLADQLRAQHTGGAVVTVVKDGEVFFTKGYGYADVDKGIPVDPQKTLFRPGSISKIFTWTALMQLIEQGKVKLDADVNTYLTQFKIPDTFPGKPIIIRNLFTHTEGMEDGALGYLIVGDVKKFGEPAQELAKHMPARVREPASGDFTNGDMASYSNWGTALAGLIVANVSGMSYEDYIEKNILVPLGMTHSTPRQPLPAALAPDMSNGYEYENAHAKAQTFEIVNFAPAGSMSVSGADMGRFMIAHLNLGKLGDGQILKEDTARMMQSRALSPSPYVNGACLGFYEDHLNGRRIIAHGGDTQFFHSEMILLPDEHVGLFVSYNSAATVPYSSRDNLVRGFMDRYFPAKLPKLKAPDDFKQRAARYAGAWRFNRQSYTKIDKLFSIIDQVTAAPTDRNTLVVHAGPFTNEWVEVKPDVFRRSDEGDVMAFSGEKNGKPQYLLNVVSLPSIQSYRVRWCETVNFDATLLGLGLLAFIVALVSYVRNRAPDAAGPLGALRARQFAALNAGVQLLFFAILGVSIASLLKEPLDDLSPLFHKSLILPILSIPLTLALPYFAWRAVRENWWTRYGRVQYVFIALASLGYLWLLNFANLIGWKFG